MINNCTYVYMYIYIITIHSFCRLFSWSLIDLVHRSEETVGVLDRRGRCGRHALVARCGGAGGWPRRWRWGRAAAALVEGRGGAGGDDHGGEGVETTTVAKMNAAALETKTKTKELPDPGQLLTYIGADPLAPVRGWNRC